MDSSDKKIKTMMTETLKELVLPKLDKIEKKLVEHDEKFVSIQEKLVEHDGKFASMDEKIDLIIEGVGDMKVEMTEMQEDIQNLNHTTERIETRLNSVVNNQNNIDLKTRQLNRRVLHLEAKKS